MVDAQSPGTQLNASHRRKLESQLKAWQDDLVNLTKRNRLLYFRHTKTSTLEVCEPDFDGVWKGLDRGWRFYLPPDPEADYDDIAEDDIAEEVVADGDERSGDIDTREPPGTAGVVDDRIAAELAREPLPEEQQQVEPPAADELVIEGKDADAIQRSLRTLERTSNQTHLDTGVWILYLAFGMLRWTEPGDDTVFESPLLLQPVQFEGRAAYNKPFRLTRSEDDPVVNQALLIKLANDFGIAVDGLDETDLDPRAVSKAFANAAHGRARWSVSDRVVLATFTFHREAMYRDLVENAELATASPLVQIVGVGPEAEAAADFAFDSIAEDDLDRVAPPEQLVSILDADATQRACIVAARDGRSFVMDGPPGSGKSQTIANIIAELLHAGKSVLFVSEKAAALDVVHKRLEAAQLAELTLELHSHKATRKEVATALGRALDTRPKATSKFAATERAALERLREELNNYAIAMHVRRPIGRSLHEVLGRVIELQQVTQAPVATGVVGVDLTPEELDRLLEPARRLVRAWGPIELRSRFLWRSVRDTAPSASRIQSVASHLLEAQGACSVLEQLTSEIVSDTGLPAVSTVGGAERLWQTLVVIEEDDLLRDVPDAWLTDPDSDGGILTTVGHLAELAAEFQRARATAESLVGPSWERIEADEVPALRNATETLTLGTGVLEPPAEATQNWFTDAIDVLGQTASVAVEILTDVADLTRAFGLEVGELTPQRAMDLGHLPR